MATKKSKSIYDMMTVKDKLTDHLYALGTEEGPINPKGNELLFNAFCWQEIASYANKKEKAAWESLLEAGLIKDDATIKQLPAGDHVLCSTPEFIVTGKLSEPRELFDLDAFVSAVAQFYKLPEDGLRRLIPACKKHSSPSLSKRVVEG